jgi:uncharacterized protein YbgA (DUF1722 family)/uncharacterized protein YbbK (DUF523 family)
MPTSDKLRLGVSACLLGERVRYDGQHKRDTFVCDTLGPFVEYVPVCPEVECGLPVPREPMHLAGNPDHPKLVTTRTGIDHTERMQSWASERVQQLEAESLCGFIFKSKSPSCGMAEVKVHDEQKHMLTGRAPGMFARAFMDHFPLLPAEEEGRLNDPDLRENFIERIFTLKRYRDAMREARRSSALTTFHAQHKQLLMAHDPVATRALGKRLATAGKEPLAESRLWYEVALLTILRKQTTLRKHTDVLMHMMGYFKKIISSDEKEELLEVIAQFKAGLLPLIVPITLLQHYVRKFQEPYLADQLYLHPHPIELKLRNHA